MHRTFVWAFVTALPAVAHAQEPGTVGWGYQGPPPVRPAPHHPADAIVQASPFFDLTIGGLTEPKRFDKPIVLGLQAGVYAGRLVRIAPQVAVMPGNTNDEYGSLPEAEYDPKQSAAASFLWGGSVGWVAAASETFALSPGLLALRTEEGDYGTFLGLELPFEWAYHDGVRMGFVLAVGSAFGGRVRGVCAYQPACTLGQAREFDREAGTALCVHFQVGHGVGYPDPLPPPR